MNNLEKPLDNIDNQIQNQNSLEIQKKENPNNTSGYRKKLAKDLLEIRNNRPVTRDNEEIEKILKTKAKESAAKVLESEEKTQIYKDERQKHLDEIKRKLNRIKIQEDIFKWDDSDRIQGPDNGGDTEVDISIQKEYEKRISIYEEVFAHTIRTIKMPNSVAFVGKDWIIFTSAEYGHAVYLLPLNQEIDLDTFDEEKFLELMSQYRPDQNKEINISILRGYGASSVNHPDHNDLNWEIKHKKDGKGRSFLSELAKRVSRLFNPDIKKSGKTLEHNRLQRNGSFDLQQPVIVNQWPDAEKDAVKSIFEEIGLLNKETEEIIASGGYLGGQFVGEPGDFIDSYIQRKSVKIDETEEYKGGYEEVEKDIMKEELDEKVEFALENKLNGIIYDVVNHNSVNKNHINDIENIDHNQFSDKLKNILKSKLLKLKDILSGTPKRRSSEMLVIIEKKLNELEDNKITAK